MRAILACSVALAAFSSGTVDTLMVKVKGNSNGPVRINASDFDETIHTLDTKETEAQPAPVTDGTTTNLPPGATVPPAPSAPNFAAPGNAPASVQGAPVAPSVPSPGQFMVMKKGSKYIVIRQSGEAVTDVAGIEAKGYATEAEAAAAINGLTPGAVLHVPNPLPGVNDVA